MTFFFQSFLSLLSFSLGIISDKFLPSGVVVAGGEGVGEVPGG